MKISIDVDEGMVGKSVEDILQNVTPEQKNVIAQEIMKEWLKTTFVDHQRKVREQEVLKEVRNASSYNRTKTDAELLSDWSFQNAMKDWKSSKQVMIETITRQMADAYKEYVKDLVENDPAFKAMKEEVGKIVRESFPKMVHDAMIVWFSGQMEAVMQGVHAASVQIPQLTKFQEDMAKRLAEVSQQRF